MIFPRTTKTILNNLPIFFPSYAFFFSLSLEPHEIIVINLS